MTKENQKIEEVNVLTPTMTEDEYAHCISVDECIERLRQRVNKHYHTEEWTKDEYFAMLNRSESATAPCQFTSLEVKEIIQKGINDYEAGLCISQEELEAESALW